MQMTTPLKLVTVKLILVHGKYGLKKKNRAEIKLLGPHNLDQTMDCEIKIEKDISPSPEKGTTKYPFPTATTLANANLDFPPTRCIYLSFLDFSSSVEPTTGNDLEVPEVTKEGLPGPPQINTPFDSSTPISTSQKGKDDGDFDKITKKKKKKKNQLDLLLFLFQYHQSTQDEETVKFSLEDCSNPKLDSYTHHQSGFTNYNSVSLKKDKFTKICFNNASFGVDTNHVADPTMYLVKDHIKEVNLLVFINGRPKEETPVVMTMLSIFPKKLGVVHRFHSP
uniref:Uncharacterized protein n=1 Tax=Lactuca sativa TaxID=4236 RepID=A0A9R1UDY3_LACSA|nr:hypothetical protein LSAT_V11C900472950 [Lactuca sativa]